MVNWIVVIPVWQLKQFVLEKQVWDQVMKPWMLLAWGIWPEDWWAFQDFHIRESSMIQLTFRKFNSVAGLVVSWWMETIRPESKICRPLHFPRGEVERTGLWEAYGEFSYTHIVEWWEHLKKTFFGESGIDQLDSSDNSLIAEKDLTHSKFFKMFLEWVSECCWADYRFPAEPLYHSDASLCVR